MTDDTPGAGKVAALYSLATAIVITVVGSVAENTAIIYWNVVPLNILAEIIFEDFVFCVAFVAFMSAWAWRERDWRILWPAAEPQQCALFSSCAPKGATRSLTLAQLLCLTGFLNTVWGILGLYASPGYRTPPLLQGILLNSTVFFVVPCSKLLLGDQKRYLSPAPLLAAVFIVAAVMVSLTPLLQAGQVSVDASRAGWVLMFLVSLLPGALESICEQAYLIRCGALKPASSAQEYWLPIMRMLLWTSIWQLLFVCALFFVDFLPWFGTSEDLPDFAAQLSATWYCSVGDPAAAAAWGARTSSGTIGVGCDWRTALSAFGAALGFVVSYIGGAALNRESATFASLSSVMVTAVASAVLLIPGVNPYPAYTPAWSVLASLALSLVGMVLWKRWELQASEEVADQFALKHDAAGNGTGGYSAVASEEEDGGDGVGGYVAWVPPAEGKVPR